MSFSIAGKTAIVTGAADGRRPGHRPAFPRRGRQCRLRRRGRGQRWMAEVGDAAERGRAGRALSPPTCARSCRSPTWCRPTIDAFDRVDILVNAAREVDRSDPLDPENDRGDADARGQPARPRLRLASRWRKRMIGAGREGRADDRHRRHDRQPVVDLGAAHLQGDDGLFDRLGGARPDDPLAGGGAGAEPGPGERRSPSPACCRRR